MVGLSFLLKKGIGRSLRELFSEGGLRAAAVNELATAALAIRVQFTILTISTISAIRVLLSVILYVIVNLA